MSNGHRLDADDDTLILSLPFITRFSIPPSRVRQSLINIHHGMRQRWNSPSSAAFRASRVGKIKQDALNNPKETIVDWLILQFTSRPTNGADEVYLRTAA